MGYLIAKRKTSAVGKNLEQVVIRLNGDCQEYVGTIEI